MKGIHFSNTDITQMKPEFYNDFIMTRARGIWFKRMWFQEPTYRESRRGREMHVTCAFHQFIVFLAIALQLASWSSPKKKGKTEEA